MYLVWSNINKIITKSLQARDFSKIQPGWMRNPTLVKMHEAMGGDIKSGIVGGDEAVPHSHPHQVGLFIDDMYFCGGSLICKFSQSVLFIVDKSMHCSFFVKKWRKFQNLCNESKEIAKENEKKILTGF